MVSVAIMVAVVAVLVSVAIRSHLSSGVAPLPAPVAAIPAVVVTVASAQAETRGGCQAGDVARARAIADICSVNAETSGRRAMLEDAGMTRPSGRGGGAKTALMELVHWDSPWWHGTTSKTRRLRPSVTFDLVGHQSNGIA